MNIKFIKTILIIIFSVFVALEGLFLFVLPASVNHFVSSGKLPDFFLDKYKVKLTTKGFNIKTYPNFSARFLAEELAISRDDEQHLYLKNADISIKLSSLGFRKLVFSAISADDLLLKIVRKSDGLFYFSDLPINYDNKNKFGFECNSGKLVNSTILLVDDFIKNNIKASIKTADFSYKKNKSLALKADALVMANNKKNIEIFFDVFSRLPIDKSVNSDDFLCEISIKNLDLNTFSSYFKHFSKGKVLSANGLVDLFVKKENVLKFNTSLKNFSLDNEEQLNSIRSENDILMSSELLFEHKKLVLKDFVAKSKDWTVKTNGHIKNFSSFNTNDMKLDLKLDVPSANIHSLYWLLPTVSEDKLNSVQYLKKYGAWGIVSGVLELKGSAKQPEVYGDLIVDDVYVVKDNPLVPHCKVFVNFIKDKVSINTRVFAGSGEYVDVEGRAELKLFGNGDFHIVSSENVDLGNALYMLVPIQKIVGFDLGPVPYMSISGKGNIDIHTKGNILDGEIDGKFNFKQTTASLDGLNLLLEKADGFLDFDKKEIHFSTNNAFVSRAPVKIDGLANLDGKLDFNIFSNELDLSQLLAILNTSKTLEAKKQLAAPIDFAKGPVKASIKLTGVVKDFAELMTNETVVISGKLLLDNVEAKLKDIPVILSKITGCIDFHNEGWKLDLAGKIGTSSVKINGFADSQKVDLKINGEKVLTSDVISSLARIKGYETFSRIPNIGSFVSFSLGYKSPKGLSDGKLYFNNVNATGNFSPSLTTKDTVKLLGGNFNLKNGTFVLNNFKASIGASNVSANLSLKDIFSSQPIVSGQMNAKDFDISVLNNFRTIGCFPETVQKLLDAYQDYQGKIDVAVKALNNKFDGNISLNGISFVHSYFKSPIQIDAGNIVLDGTKVILTSVIAQIDKTPLYLNLSLNDLDKTMKISGYVTTKFTETFANKYINAYLTYPIKPRGDITVTADISGTPDKILFKPVMKLAPQADIYYMGANLGDDEEERQVLATVNVVGNKYYLKKAEYVRYMTSQNDKSYPLPIILANGLLEQNPQTKQFFIKNLNVKTLNSANAKIFNFLFKKSVLKQGVFNCNVNVKGDMKNPKLVGDVAVKNIDMPLYDTTLKNINLKLNDKTIDINADGIIYNSDIQLLALVNNSLKPPYVFEKFDIKSGKLNLDKLIDVLTVIPTPTTTTKLVEYSKSALPVNISDVLIKKGSLFVKDIVIRDLSANNYQSEFSLGKDIVLNVDKLAFDVTTGKMTGTASYNFKNERFKTNVSAINVDSNKVATSLFGFENQIFGQANGNIVMSTTGTCEEERIKNMTGYVYFEIADGKMPKLGSVEYLLKAGNFVKSGITGASINNLLELLAPVKTGYFNSIKGSLALKNGVAQDIEIYSKGENLNLYINGEYDILQKLANMRVYGRLTKKASGVLGPIGNLSLNSLLNSIPGFRLGKDEKNTLLNDLNKIPGVELNDKDYRRFTVKIDGEINDDNKFVKNFRWIE